MDRMEIGKTRGIAETSIVDLDSRSMADHLQDTCCRGKRVIVIMAAREISFTLVRFLEGASVDVFYNTPKPDRTPFKYDPVTSSSYSVLVSSNLFE